MDIVIADAEMRTAAGAIEDALYQLSSICSRAVPIIKGLQDTGALSSENLDEKYQQQLADHLNALATTMEELHEGVLTDAMAFAGQIDEIDSFVY